MKNSTLPVSLVVIALNEELRIQDCLRSASWCQERLVVDTGSTDETKKIAEAAGAKVQSMPWSGFGKTKRAAALAAENDWILSLDADERLSPELSREIQHKFAELDPRKIYFFPRRSFHLGRWIRHGGWYPDYQPRLFHRQHANWNAAEIHESIVSHAMGKSKMQSDLQHLVFRDLSHQVVTNDRYSSLQAKDLFLAGRKSSLAKLLIKPTVKFFENYVWKQGFRDGLPGFVIAIGSAYSVFLKWAKLWELEFKQKGNLK